MRVLLHTDRLVLRAFTPDDLDELFELDNDPDVMHFLNGGRPVDRRVVEEQTLPRLMRHDEQCPAYGYWAAVERSTGGFLGWFQFAPPVGAAAGEVELGYRLRVAAWGRGYATEGSRALIRLGFTGLGVQRVIATTMTVNHASRRVMEKAGLSLVRTFHEQWDDPIEGAEHGDVEYALRRSDWRE